MRFKLSPYRKARLIIKLQRLLYATTYRLGRWPRPLLKDPVAALSAEFLATHYNVNVVVTIRHPVAVVNSINRVGWRYDGYGHFLDTQLINDWLYPFKSDLQREPADIIEESAIYWKCINFVLNEYIKRNSNWIVKRHEDISLDPIKHFDDIYTRLGLPFTDTVKARIKKLRLHIILNNAPSNVTHHLQRDSRALAHSWKQTVGEDEIKRIRELTESVASQLYNDDEW